MENIRIENLCVDFGSNKVLHDVSFSVNEGEFICVVGKNGSGKSTLAKTLNGLIKPTSGDVYIYGMNTKDEDSIINIRKTIGMAFQNPDNQIVASIVEEDIAFGLENLGIETDVMRKRIDEAMKKLSIYDLKDALTSKLSGGQKQKVAIAGILAMKSKIIILDEPTSMVDKLSRKEILDMVKKLNKEEKITVILISHYVEEMFLSDRVFVMNEGKIVLTDTPKNILKKREILNNCGIELPYIPRLAQDLRDKGYNCSGTEIEISELIKK